MVAYVPGFEHDVFVSYARVDNEEYSWVSTLVRNLDVRLAQALGGKPRPSIWIDHQIRGNEPVNQIFRIIEKTAVMLLVLSPGYRISDWCRGELLKFIKTRHEQGNRVFVVRIDEKYDSDQCPEALRALPGYDFFVQDKEKRFYAPLGLPETKDEDDTYWLQVRRLSSELAEYLKATASAAGRVVSDESVARVFLAESFDVDLEGMRFRIQEALEQAGIEVVPQDLAPLSNIVEFEARARRLLPSCKVFVQLLNARAVMPTGFCKSVSTLQFELANEAKVPNIIQWREAAGCRIEDAPNDEHRDLLKHESVWTLNESQLVSEIIRAVKSRNISIASSSRTSAPVFVHSDLCDRLLAQSVTQCLNTKGLTAELLPEQGNVREFLEEKLLLCNAALLVHGKSDWAWVNEHVTHFAMNRVRRLSSKPPRTPAMVGLLEAGRTNGYTLDANLPELASYEMKGDMDDTSLNAVIDRFVAQLSQRSHGQHAF